MDKVMAIFTAYPKTTTAIIAYLLGHGVGFLIGLQF